MPQPRYILLASSALLAFLATASRVHAEVPAALTADEAAIRAAAKQYFSAMQRGDIKSLSQLWTSEGDYVDAAGQTFKSQDLLRSLGATPSADSRTGSNSPPASSLRFIGSNVAVEDGYIGTSITSTGGRPSGRFTAIWVKRDGHWLLDGLREAGLGASSGRAALQSLEWLLGEWTALTDDAVVMVSSRWSEGGNYIVREFVIRSDGREEVGGTQRIGWDPTKDQLRCWTFDSLGGSGEGVWQRVGNDWIVDSDEVLADGSKSSTIAIYTPLGDDRFVWEISSAKVNGVTLPKQRVEFVRAAKE